VVVEWQDGDARRTGGSKMVRPYPPPYVTYTLHTQDQRPTLPLHRGPWRVNSGPKGALTNANLSMHRLFAVIGTRQCARPRVGSTRRTVYPTVLGSDAEFGIPYTIWPQTEGQAFAAHTSRTATKMDAYRFISLKSCLLLCPWVLKSYLPETRAARWSKSKEKGWMERSARGLRRTARA
jgi:hypothetical protein